MWGPTLIKSEGAEVAKSVFGGWAGLLAAGPPRLVLTGRFSWPAADDAPAAGERVTQLEGDCERLEFDRDELVGVLKQLAGWCDRVRSGAGKLYLYHGGV
jgi:hypothetical protein